MADCRRLKCSSFAAFVMNTRTPIIRQHRTISEKCPHFAYCDMHRMMIHELFIRKRDTKTQLISMSVKLLVINSSSTYLIRFVSVIFASLGLSGLIPAIHIAIKHGFVPSLTKGQLGWLYLMAILYLTGKL